MRGVVLGNHIIYSYCVHKNTWVLYIFLKFFFNFYIVHIIVENAVDERRLIAFFSRCSSNRLFFLGFVVLTALVTAVIVYSQFIYEKPDPEFTLPPPKMRMGVYKHVGIVSQGEQCPQIGV